MFQKQKENVKNSIFNKLFLQKSTSFGTFDTVHYSKNDPFISIRIRPKNCASAEQAITACLNYIEDFYGEVFSYGIQDLENQEIRITVKIRPNNSIISQAFGFLGKNQS